MAPARNKVVVLGAGGLLGRAVMAAARAAGRPAVGLLHAACDVAEPGAVRAALERERPALVVNAAAATDVERCEREPVWAWRVNALGARRVAAAAAAVGARLVHVSTDYVFDGAKGAAYDESDPPRPLSAYGRSKLAGERAVLALLPGALVVRTAWLFGPGGTNFVSRMPELLRRQGQLEAIADRWSSPTAADDLAAWILACAERAAGGLYHVVNPGVLSYAEAARAIARALGLDPARAVVERPAAAYRFAAARPRCSALCSLALPAEGLPALRPAAEALAALARSG
ncbi:MAG: NAD(P)-dependent oxidoreductase [Planctomycetota bacterium]|nr:MAG: NAD(P)-dependent oxidoreductase [Planctomycetota bacterium]